MKLINLIETRYNDPDKLGYHITELIGGEYMPEDEDTWSTKVHGTIYIDTSEVDNTAMKNQTLKILDNHFGEQIRLKNFVIWRVGNIAICLMLDNFKDGMILTLRPWDEVRGIVS